MAQASACRWVKADSASAGCRKTSLTSAGISPALSSWPRIWPWAELPLPTAMDLPRRSAIDVIGESAVHQDLVPDPTTVVRRDHLDLGAGGRTEDRRGVAGDGEVDLAGGGGLDLRRSGGERGELHLVRQVVQLTGRAQQRLGATLLITDLQGQSGKLGQRHGRRRRGGGRTGLPRHAAASGRPSEQNAMRAASNRRNAGMRIPFFE